MRGTAGFTVSALDDYYYYLNLLSDLSWAPALMRHHAAVIFACELSSLEAECCTTLDSLILSAGQKGYLR